MKLLTLNIDDRKFTSLVKSMGNDKGDEVLLVDWLPLPTPATQEKTTRKIKNIEVVNSTPDDVRLVIFDRYSILKKHEIDYYLKKNAILLEPVLRPRPGFLFMPYWINRIDLPLAVWDKKRPFHTGFIDNTPRVEYLSKMARYAANINGIDIGITTGKLPEDQYNVLSNIASIGDFHINQFQTTFITGNHNDYHFGVMPDIRTHLRNGVIPIVSHNHKWFHALFKNFIEFDISTMQWYYTMNKKISGYGFMDEIYNNIGKYMPEMFAENFIQTIISLCGK